MVLDDFELLARLGVAVEESRRLKSEVCYLEDQSLALIRFDLPPSARREAAAWLVSEVLCRAVATSS